MTWRVKLHRKVQNNQISENLELLGLFSYFLTKANHKENTILIWHQMVHIKPWQFVSSIRKLADHFDVSIGKIQRLVKSLEMLGIAIHKWYTKYSLFTILNRGKYQDSDTQVDTQTGTQVGHKQEWLNNDKRNSTFLWSLNNIKLTDDELAKLKNMFTDLEEKIETLSLYVASSWKKYKSHYATILNWARKDKPKQPTTETEWIDCYNQLGRQKFQDIYWQEKAAEINKKINLLPWA